MHGLAIKLAALIYKSLATAGVGYTRDLNRSSTIHVGKFSWPSADPEIRTPRMIDRRVCTPSGTASWRCLTCARLPVYFPSTTDTAPQVVAGSR